MSVSPLSKVAPATSAKTGELDCLVPRDLRRGVDCILDSHLPYSQ